MRIQLKIDGGLAYFPGLSKPITIDSNALPAQEAEKLKQLLDAAHCPSQTGDEERGDLCMR